MIEKFTVHVRFSLASSLLWSKLFFNTQTWSAVPKRALQLLETAYHRPLRRITGTSLYQKSDNLNSLLVRKKAPPSPSKACWLRRGSYTSHVCTPQTPRQRFLPFFNNAEGGTMH